MEQIKVNIPTTAQGVEVRMSQVGKDIEKTLAEINGLNSQVFLKEQSVISLMKERELLVAAYSQLTQKQVIYENTI